MKSCVGCGIVKRADGDGIGGDDFPYVGVGRDDLDAGTGAMTAHPVCALCYADPGHRSLRPSLKVTFFEAKDRDAAVRAAQSTDRQSKSGANVTIGM